MLFLFSMLNVVSFPAFAADDLLKIGWNDLVAPVEPYEDPFLTLNSDQLMDLSIVAQIRARKERDKNIPQYILDELEKKEELLAEQGIDVEGLLAQREIIKAKRQAAAAAANPSLDGKQIRMAGYMLPLDYDGELVVEFLLVPFIGACIHVPPPPPNQIVHVKLQSGYRNTILYAPVAVEGRIHVGEIERDLYLVDGSSNIPMSYSMLADKVEPFNDSE